MDSEERRAYISQRLETAEDRVRGMELAKVCQVSRQVIVGDVALLRARGMDIISTPRGYYVKKPEGKGVFHTFVCCHETKDTGEELFGIVHAGGKVHNVTIEHEIYGDLVGQLDIETEKDVEHFLARVKETGASLLSTISGGIHTHLVETQTEEEMKAVEDTLRRLGILYENKD